MIDQWAQRWGVSREALEDLRALLILDSAGMGLEAPRAGSEARAQQDVRLEAAERGLILWRNNVGAFEPPGGGWVRYGLANDSQAVNARVKSGDLIGIRPRVITPADVGRTFGQFVSREVKRPGWRWSGTERELAQLAWAHLVIGLGGDAAFCTGRGSL